MPAPAMRYVMPDNFTPAHRAQLVRSNKKLEQILGVTPSLLPIAPTPQPNQHHRRAKSMGVVQSPTSPTRRDKARERGKLASIFNATTTTRQGDQNRDSAQIPFARVSRTSSRTSNDSLSTASTSHDDFLSQIENDLPIHRDLTPKRLQRRHRPPRLNLSDSSSSGTNSSAIPESVMDISPHSSAVMDRIDVESPLSPTFHLNLANAPRGKKHDIEGDEDDVLTEIFNNNTYRPIDKRTKLSRLARHFGTQPPLELVFPPSPTSRSRHNPKRYTYGLPAPLVNGVILETKIKEGVRGLQETILEKRSLEGDSKVLQVFWDSVEDERGRTQVMNALRDLRS